MRIRLFAERWVTSPSLVKPTVALMKSRSMILPVSTSPERKFSIPSRRSALRKPGSRFTRARIVSLKSRVKAIVVPFLPLFAAYNLAIGPAQYGYLRVDVFLFRRQQGLQGGRHLCRSKSGSLDQ